MLCSEEGVKDMLSNAADASNCDSHWSHYVRLGVSAGLELL
jgi:hypothetical protein